MFDIYLYDFYIHFNGVFVAKSVFYLLPVFMGSVPFFLYFLSLAFRIFRILAGPSREVIYVAKKRIIINDFCLETKAGEIFGGRMVVGVRMCGFSQIFHAVSFGCIDPTASERDRTTASERDR